MCSDDKMFLRIPDPNQLSELLHENEILNIKTECPDNFEPKEYYKVILQFSLNRELVISANKYKPGVLVVELRKFTKRGRKKESIFVEESEDWFDD